VGFIKQNSEYKVTFTELILTVWEGENTVGVAELRGRRFNKRKEITMSAMFHTIIPVADRCHAVGMAGCGHYIT